MLTQVVWGDLFVNTAVTIFGDNTGAWSNALTYRGRGPMEAVARELSWRQARRRWLFEVAHLPSEHNEVADALSRVADPHGIAWPAVALAPAEQLSPPRVSDLWRANPK